MSDGIVEGEGVVEVQNEALSVGIEVAGQTGQYEVLAITVGEGNGLTYTDAALSGAVPLFEGASCFLDHGGMETWFGGRSLRSLLGVLHSAWWDAERSGVRGILQLYPGPDAAWFAPMVERYLADRAAGKSTPRVGLSAIIDVKVKGREVVSIDRVVSVDAVFDPARGGEFIRAINQQREVTVAEKVVASVAADLAEQGASRPPVVERAASEPRPLAAARDGSSRAEVPAGGGVDASVVAALHETLVEARLARSQMPERIKELLRGEALEAPFSLAKLDARIEALQSAWGAAMAQAGTVRAVGEARDVGAVRVGLSEMDRLQAVMDRMCGLKAASEALAGQPPVSGIRELYLMLSGDYEFRGIYDQQRVKLANVDTTTMTSLVKNAFNKVIMDYFNVVERWWEPVVAQDDFESTKDLTLITLGGFADLPTVSEGAAYTELAWSDTEEVVAFVKKGGYCGVTLEMMDKDETRAFRAIPRKIAIAGFRTLSAAIANLWTANAGVGAYWPSSQAVLRLFHTTYGNLGTTALSAAAWDAVIQAMYKQTEATSGERMGIRPAYLVVPIELEKTALTIMNSEGEPGTGDNDANVRRGSSRIVVCPEMTDVNDWLAVADPKVWPGMMVGFRFGRTPEVFVADQEQVGSMFTNDEMRVKARYWFAVGVGDYRPLYKSNV